MAQRRKLAPATLLTRSVRVSIVVLVGCSGVRPAEEPAERRDAEVEGRPFVVPHEKRELPNVVPDAPIEDVLRYAFLSNAGIEKAYFEWRMALERVPQAVSADDPRLSYDFLFSKERMTRWDRTTLGASQMVPFPGKLETAGEAAMSDAVAARRRFEDAKFMLQADVVSMWQELAMLDRSIEIGRENVRLLEDFAEVARGRLAAGTGMQSDATKADLELAAARNDLATRESERPAAVARINSLLSRPASTAVVPKPTGRLAPVPADDARTVELVAERNADLRAMAAEVKGAESGLELARKQYLPDFEFSFSVTGTMERMLGAMVTAPLRLDRIKAGIEEASAGVRAAQAATRARRDDVRAQVILRLYIARDTQRRLAVLDGTLIPRAQEVIESVRAGYAAGSGSFLELLDAQRSLLELRMAVAEAYASHESAVAALEALAALDFGALAGKEELR
jgi:outer membrane protein TolC